MSATGLDVFDKTLQTTNIWLDEVMADSGPYRQTAGHVLGADAGRAAQTAHDARAYRARGGGND